MPVHQGFLSDFNALSWFPHLNVNKQNLISLLYDTKCDVRDASAIQAAVFLRWIRANLLGNRQKMFV